MFHRPLGWYCTYCAAPLITGTSKGKPNKTSRLSGHPPIWSSDYQLGCTVAAVSAQQLEEHVNIDWQNITTEWMTHIVWCFRARTSVSHTWIIQRPLLAVSKTTLAVTRRPFFLVVYGTAAIVMPPLRFGNPLAFLAMVSATQPMLLATLWKNIMN